MASGKKGKRTKGITIPLTDFLQESGGSLPSQPIRKSTPSWADEIDNDVVDPKTVNMVLPTAPKASRDYDDIANNVPKEPPFMAYLSNLPYDVDEDEIADFFRNMKIRKMIIPKEDRSETPKLKGYGYVEFEDRESLMAALIIPDTTLKNRRIRIEVASNTDNDRKRGRQGMGDRMGGSDTGGDWRSSNRPDPVDERRGEGRFSRDREGREGGGGAFTREGMREAGAGRDRDFGGFNRDREGGFNRDREGGFNRDREGGFNRDREGGFNRERDFGRDRDSGFNRDGGFSRNRDQDERPGAWRDGERDRDRGFSRPTYRDSERNRDDRDDRRGGGFRRYDDKDERNGGFARSSNRGDKDDRETESHSTENRQRPKLQLAPRTKPLEPAASIEPAVPSASIFGSAKPVDTTERERQVEEKLLKQQEERLTETTRDKKEKEKSGDEGGEKKSFNRGRPPARKEDGDSESHIDKEVNSRERGPPQRDRNASEEGHLRSAPPRSDTKSPDKKKLEKPDKEKKAKSEVEMPKFQDPEPPNFQGNNKFALLDDDSD